MDIGVRGFERDRVGLKKREIASIIY